MGLEVTPVDGRETVGLVAMSSSTFSVQEMGLEVTPVDGRETVGSKS